MSGGSDRPMRDVSADSAIGECEHCGGNARLLLGGEHLWKCSEVVPVALLEEIADDWEQQATGNADWNEYNEGVHDALRSAAERIREVADE